MFNKDYYYIIWDARWAKTDHIMDRVWKTGSSFVSLLYICLYCDEVFLYLFTDTLVPKDSITPHDSE